MKTPTQNKKKSLVRIATRLFKKEGFSSVSVEDIVRAGETSIASFYSHFSAKEELVCIDRNSTLERCLPFYRKLAADARVYDFDPMEKLRRLIFYIMGLLEKTGPQFGRIFAQYRLRQRNGSPEDKPYLPLFVQLMEEGQQAGVIRADYTARQLAEVTDMALMGAHIRWLLHRSDKPMDAVCGEVMAMHCQLLSPDMAGAQRNFDEAWETALYMLLPDPRSGIKQMEEDWLERFRDS